MSGQDLEIKKDDFEAFKALIIDDNDFIRLTITELLHGFGLKKITEAKDGSHSLQAVTADTDIIICDIHMEPVNGFDFLKNLRASANAKINKIPVLFLTADADADLVKKALLLGVSGYLLKPLTREGLKSKLIKLLANKVPLRDAR